MRDWLLNFYSIREDYPDLSDYNIFLTNSIIYLRTDLNIHAELNSILIKCLYKFKNPYLIYMTFRLINTLQYKTIIPHEIIKMYINEHKLKDEIFCYLSNNYDSCYENIILNNLFDYNFLSNQLYSLCKLFLQGSITKLLDLKDPNFIKKQVDLMISLRFFINLEYFISFIGSNDRSICFSIFEMIMCIVKNNSKCNFLKIKNSCVTFCKPINVESIDNFIFYFIDFFENKNELIEFYYQKKTDNLEYILNDYVQSRSKINYNYKKLFLSEEIYDENDGIRMHENINFDYLFRGDHYKIQSDCIEI